MQALGGNAQHRNVGGRVTAQHLGGVFTPVGQQHGDRLGVLHHMGVGEDQAVGRDDEARALAPERLGTLHATVGRELAPARRHGGGLVGVGDTFTLDHDAHHRWPIALHDGAVVGCAAGRQGCQRCGLRQAGSGHLGRAGNRALGRVQPGQIKSAGSADDGQPAAQQGPGQWFDDLAHAICSLMQGPCPAMAAVCAGAVSAACVQSIWM